MFFQVPVYIALMIILVHGTELDPGPQTFTKSNSSSPSHTHKRFTTTTKDVVVYLTPSQIMDLESGRAELRYTAPDQITINKVSNNQRATYQNPQESYHRHLENLNILKAPLIPEPQNNQGKDEQKLLKEPAEKHAQRLSNLRVLQLGTLNLINEQITHSRPVTPVVQNDNPSSHEFNENWQKVFQKNREQLKQIFHYGSSSDPAQLNLDAQKYGEIENILRKQTKPPAQTETFDLLRLPNVQKIQDQPILRQAFPAPAALPYEINLPRLHLVPVENTKHNTEQFPITKESNQNNKQSFIKNIYINVDSPIHG